MLREIDTHPNYSSPSTPSEPSSAPPLEPPKRPRIRRTDSERSVWRPTLDQVLANIAPPPYTLSAFMAYLSQNHCLETLEFTLDAKRYRESYYSVIDQLGESGLSPDASGSQHLRMLWQLLLTAYVLPGAPREVNLSVDVRDALLKHKDMSTPPLPEALNPAVKSIHDLMEDSIFVSFLNSHSTTSTTDPTSDPFNGRQLRPHRMLSNPDDRPTRSARLRVKRPTISPIGRTWSWPPWTRQAD